MIDNANIGHNTRFGLDSQPPNLSELVCRQGVVDVSKKVHNVTFVYLILFFLWPQGFMEYFSYLFTMNLILFKEKIYIIKITREKEKKIVGDANQTQKAKGI